MYKSYYIVSEGKIIRKDGTLSFVSYDETITQDMPVKTISDIFVCGTTELSYDARVLCSKEGIQIHYFNRYSYYLGSFVPKEPRFNPKLLMKQIEHYKDDEKRLELGKLIISSAFKNINRNINYYSKDKISVTKYFNINKILIDIENTTNINHVMLVEAKYRKEYYSYFPSIMGLSDFVRDCPNSADIVNILLNFLNSLLYSIILSEIYHTNISPIISYIHEPTENRYSLVFDISEIFKPLIVDRLLFRIINEKIITSDDLTNDNSLLEASVKNIFKIWDKEIMKTFYHRELKRYVNYRELIRLELYKLEKHFMGEEKYNPFVCWW